jgi:nitroimidazol reductase NimA-like FMN-containing flavoprotein (pyridoxamine 5'-phosphate oxidase superfamily)
MVTTAEPTLGDVEGAIADLLREEEIGSLAVLGPDGAPAVSMMHFASDGLIAYLTFTFSRKLAAIARDPRVSYTIAMLPPGGYSERREARSVQIEGRASFVTDPAEIERAVEVSLEQFEWAKDTSIFKTFGKGTAHHQRFIRLEPVEALWLDNRVRMMWRTLVTFTPDGKHVAALSPYEKVRDTAPPRGDESAAR